MNVGEELVASYLRHIKDCEFTQQNLYTPDVQGEIDVVGINLKEKTVYICEVAIHLVTGLQYVKDKRPNNVGKLSEKFSRDIEYTRKSFPDYKHVFMFWSPIVKGGKVNIIYNQLDALKAVDDHLKTHYEVSVEFVINKKFQDRITELRKYAASKTEELKCPVLRLLQIEELLSRHLNRGTKEAAITVAIS